MSRDEGVDAILAEIEAHGGPVYALALCREIRTLRAACREPMTVQEALRRLRQATSALDRMLEERGGRRA